MPLTPVDSEFSYKELLLMPLKGTIGLSIVGLSLLYLMSVYAGILGLWLRILVIVAVVRYAQITTEKIMYGYREPPPLSPQDFNLYFNFGALGFYALLILLYLVAIYIVDPIGPVASFVYGALILFALPAMLAASVIENSVSTAINPVRIAQIIKAIGWRYVGVFAIVVAGFLIGSTVAAIANARFVNVLTGFYAIFLLSCAVGRLVYISRAELGLNIRSQQELKDHQDLEYVRTQDNAALQIALQTSRLAPTEAAAELWRYHDRANTSADRQLACFNALKLWPESMTALKFSQPLAERLVSSERNDDALDVVRWCIETEPAFRLADAQATYSLGMFAINIGQYKLGAFILQDMGRRFADNPNATNAMFKVAVIAAERLGHAPLLHSAIIQLATLGVSKDDERIVKLIAQLKELKAVKSSGR